MQTVWDHLYPWAIVAALAAAAASPSLITGPF